MNTNSTMPQVLNHDVRSHVQWLAGRRTKRGSWHRSWKVAVIIMTITVVLIIYSKLHLPATSFHCYISTIVNDIEIAPGRWHDNHQNLHSHQYHRHRHYCHHWHYRLNKSIVTAVFQEGSFQCHQACWPLVQANKVKNMKNMVGFWLQTIAKAGFY